MDKTEISDTKLTTGQGKTSEVDNQADVPLSNFSNTQKISTLSVNTMVSIQLKICRLVEKTSQSKSYLKMLLTDGTEFMTITEWNTDFYKNLRNNDVVLMEKFLVLVENRDQYFFKTNTRNLTLLKNSISSVDKLKIKLSDPPLLDFEYLDDYDVQEQCLISFKGIVKNLKQYKKEGKRLLIISYLPKNG